MHLGRMGPHGAHGDKPQGPQTAAHFHFLPLGLDP
jgi:hypothetical protein